MTTADQPAAEPVTSETNAPASAGAAPIDLAPVPPPVSPVAPPPPPIDFATGKLPLDPDTRQPYLRLMLISFFLLFFELACIRWFGSTVVFLTFFTNIVLIATFLGMSVGLMTATRKTNFIHSTLPLAALACGLSAALLYAYNRFPQFIIAVGNQKSPAAIYFGTEYRDEDISKTVVIPMPAIAGVFFTLISLMFVGLGQEMGRAFDAISNRLAAYTVDILGSLLGIALFSALSYAWSSPLIWFIIAAVLMLYFVRRWTPLQSVSLVIVLSVTGFTSYYDSLGGSLTWSPYYKVAYRPVPPEQGKLKPYEAFSGHAINTNNIAHQNMEQLSVNALLYPLVHALNRDAAQPPFGNVMIIGAGSGNDVDAALMNGVQHVDAVEIDPAINFIGQQFHPDKPYKDPRVNIHITDGRQWLKKHAAMVAGPTPVDSKYDLEIYALVDSLVLHSSYSSLRLESFLFTQQAFEDVRSNLKPGGVFATYNYFRQGWVVGRIVETARHVFHTEPLVFSFTPPGYGKQRDTISAGDNEANSITFCITGMPDDVNGLETLAPDAPLRTNARIEAIRAKLKAAQTPQLPNGDYWLAGSDTIAKKINGFGEVAPALPPATQPTDFAAQLVNQFKEARPAIVDTANIGPLPTDDWPQLYLREKSLPPEVRQSMIVIGSLSLVMLLIFSPKVALVPSGRMFFLGAGFMLLETKGVVHMSLLFGATWITNSVVFFAILVMVLLANVFVLIVKPQKLWPYYLLLFATLAVNAFIPMSSFLTLTGLAKPIVSCAVVFIPVFFAGVIFGSSFRDSRRPDADLGWNIAGIIVGALAENFAVVIGFKYLILVAIGFYLLSMPFARRRVAVVG